MILEFKYQEPGFQGLSKHHFKLLNVSLIVTNFDSLQPLRKLL